MDEDEVIDPIIVDLRLGAAITVKPTGHVGFSNPFPITLVVSENRHKK